MWLLKVESACFLLQAPPRRFAGRFAAVVVEDVRERREEDLLEREARSVPLVAGPAGPEVVRHRGDVVALVGLAVPG